MSKDPAGTRHPHLDLGDLIAGAAGQPVGEGPEEHLAECEGCRLEAHRWNIIAEGIRGLTAATHEPADAVVPWRNRQRVRLPWRRAALVAGSAAAALVLLIGVGMAAGFVHVQLSSSANGTTLAAVTGCDQLRQADGTLRKVNGRSLVIQMSSGKAVTVTTTASTLLSMSGPLRSDITDGASVMVRGYQSDGALQAAIVTVGQPFSAVRPPGFVPVQGTVADARSNGFALVLSSGVRLPVIISADTLVVVPHASAGQLRAGTPVFAVGHLGPDGTLSAQAVAAVSQLPSGLGTHVSLSVRNCSPGSVAAALGAISAARGPAG